MLKSSSRHCWYSKLAVTLCLGVTSAPLLPLSAQMIRPSLYRGDNPVYRNDNRNQSPAYGNNNSRSWEQQRNNDRFNPINAQSSDSLSSGTTIFAIYQDAEKIYVTKDETLPLTLTVNRDIRNNQNRVIIPAGSQIKGEIRPDRGNRIGSRFFAQTVVFPNGVERSINAESNIVSRTEVVERGKDTDNVWKGAVAGAAAATLISGVTGNRVIATEKILGGAGLGALAGYLLSGQRTAEVISFDAKRDLDLVLRSNFNL
ncbi:MAG: hypothetical protein IGQ45_07445 [Cyanobacterium sp. T60_A2020_053]|nr:hypothetical protein [Cyanobacterium sp. T60_A2020_053]